MRSSPNDVTIDKFWQFWEVDEINAKSDIIFIVLLLLSHCIL